MTKTYGFSLLFLALVVASAGCGTFGRQKAPLSRTLDGVWTGGAKGAEWGLTLAADGRALFCPPMFVFYSTWTQEGTNTVVVDLGGLVPGSSVNSMMVTNLTERFVYDASSDTLEWVDGRGERRADRRPNGTGTEGLDEMIARIRKGLKDGADDWRGYETRVESVTFASSEELVVNLKSRSDFMVSFSPLSPELREAELKLSFIPDRGVYGTSLSYVDSRYRLGAEEFRGKGVKLPEIGLVAVEGDLPTPDWTCDEELRHVIENAVEGRPEGSGSGNGNLSECRISDHCWVKDVARLRQKPIGDLKEEDLLALIKRLPARLFPFPGRYRIETVVLK